jgi:tRNA1(Val) A37 N6-methylase TrmN6
MPRPVAMDKACGIGQGLYPYKSRNGQAMPQSDLNPGSTEDIGPNWSQDTVLGGKVVLRQPKVGYRAGLDAALLAAACDSGPQARVIEAGCGVGGALLAAAFRRPHNQFVGIERDRVAADLGQTNIALNALQDRVQIINAALPTSLKALDLEPFDAALCNPPFFDDPGTLRSPDASRLGAYMADDGLEAWTGFLLKSVREGGTLTLIHRADRLGDILGLLAPKAGSIRIRPVQPFSDTPAKRVLVQAIKTGKAPLVLLPALVLHDRSTGQHTAKTEAILRGQADLGWEP